MNWTMELGGTAFFWGCISAVSLPLGALLGLWLRPGRKITSGLMAFGAGALLFALTIELFGVALHHVEEHGKGVLVATIVGALIGGLLFDFLNQMLNNRGAFLRSFSNTKNHLFHRKMKTAQQIVEELGEVKILKALPAEDVAKLLPHLKTQNFKAGEKIFQQGEPGEALFFIQSGEVEIIFTKPNGEKQLLATLDPDDTFGEMALLVDRPRNATALAKTPVEVYQILKLDFDNLLATSPMLQGRVRDLIDDRVGELMAKAPESDADPEWVKTCQGQLTC